MKARAHASIASIPGRVDSLKEAVRSLLDQVSTLTVHLNGYRQVPTFLNHSRINVSLTSWNRGARQKLRFLQVPGQFYLTCDDDLVYPQDYAEKMATSAKELGGIVCVHGARVSPEFLRYRDSMDIFHYNDPRYSPVRVHVPGTGTMGFWGGSFSPPKCVHKNMVDIEVGVAALKQGVKIHVIPHRNQWLRSLLQPAGTSIYDSVVEGKDEIQSDLIRGQKWPTL